MIIDTTSSGPYFSQVQDLGGTDFTLDFRYNFHDNLWRMDVSDLEGNVLIAGMALVCGVKLNLGMAVYPNFPQGSFVVVSQTADTSPPTYLDLGQRCLLTFWEGM